MNDRSTTESWKTTLEMPRAATGSCVTSIPARSAVPLARGPITGSTAVARQILARGTRLASLAQHAVVNGSAGVVVGTPGRPIAVVGFTVARNRIVAIDLITDPAKLLGLGRGRAARRSS